MHFVIHAVDRPGALNVRAAIHHRIYLQIVEFGHMAHPGAERARCDALPGQHTEHAPAENVQLFGPLTAVVGSTASTASMMFGPVI